MTYQNVGQFVGLVRKTSYRCPCVCAPNPSWSAGDPLSSSPSPQHGPSSTPTRAKKLARTCWAGTSAHWWEGNCSPKGDASWNNYSRWLKKKTTKFQLSFKKLGVNKIISKSWMCSWAKEQWVVHSQSPNVWPSRAANACVLRGHADTKQLTEVQAGSSASVVPAVWLVKKTGWGPAQVICAWKSTPHCQRGGWS